MLLKLIEDKLYDDHQLPTYPNLHPAIATLPPLLVNPNKHPFVRPLPPIKHLTWAKIITKHEKGHYCNYDEPFSKNHVCKGKLFSFLIYIDSTSSTNNTKQILVTQLIEQTKMYITDGQP